MSATSKKSSYNYGQFYSEIKLIQNVSVPQDEQRWLTTTPKNPTPHDVVLYLGCNVMRTSHMVRTVYDLFKILDVDFIAVGGGSFCCGSPYFREGDLEAARSVNEHTVENFSRYQPETLVMWCPSCIHTYDEVMQTEWPYKTQHVTQFLVERLDQMKFVGEVPSKIAMHYHIANDARKQEAEAARTLLEALPGAEYVDIGSDARFGRHCTAQVQEQLGMDVWNQMVTGQIQAAAKQGADIFATIYHGCQRLMCHLEEEGSIPIEHYLSVFARALGIEYEDQFKKWKLWKDPDAVLADMAPCMTGNNVDAEKARAMVTQTFPS